MLNKLLIFKIIGSLLMLESVFMILSFCIALIYHDDDIISLMLSSIVTLGASITCRYIGRNATGAWDVKTLFSL